MADQKQQILIQINQQQQKPIGGVGAGGTGYVREQIEGTHAHSSPPPFSNKYIQPHINALIPP